MAFIINALIEPLSVTFYDPDIMEPMTMAVPIIEALRASKI